MPLFSESERQRIQEAVAAAEGRTAGEIVPYVVDRSDRYDVATWRGAAFGALLALAAGLLLSNVYDGWGLAWLYAHWGATLLATLGGTAGALLGAYAPPLTRLLAGADRLDQSVHRRALQAFVDEEVFTTRDRTGILLFVSLQEHRIEVVGDAGINWKVGPDDWADVVEAIRGGIRSGHLADGLIEAIGLCGKLLERQGVEIRPDDTNELPDGVRVRNDS